MPKIESIKKVLVIGSGPIVIGQAAEFDYAGTQACRSLKEEGIEVVLVNSNPATIMTDKDIADGFSSILYLAIPVSKLSDSIETFSILSSCEPDKSSLKSISIIVSNSYYYARKSMR